MHFCRRWHAAWIVYDMFAAGHRKQMLVMEWVWPRHSAVCRSAGGREWSSDPVMTHVLPLTAATPVFNEEKVVVG
jgi:hypothetical protein